MPCVHSASAPRPFLVQAAASISFNNHIHDAIAANYKVMASHANIRGQCAARLACTVAAGWGGPTHALLQLASMVLA